jgi:hypothetical protein
MKTLVLGWIPSGPRENRTGSVHRVEINGSKKLKSKEAVVTSTLPILKLLHGIHLTAIQVKRLTLTCHTQLRTATLTDLFLALIQIGSGIGTNTKSQ